MQREIKFKAWVKQEKKIFPVSDLSFDGNDDEPVGVNGCGDSSCPTCVEWYPFEFIELMQYTGLKDKNGVEIYEGDIIKDVDNRAHTVIYERGMFGCYKTWLVSYETGERQKSIESLNNFLIDEAIVIGNIYENPELLEVK